MPSAVKYVPATDKERNNFARDVGDERNRRRTAYRHAIRYYVGDHDNQLEIDPDVVDDNVRINLVKMTADRTVSFLFPKVPQFKLDKNSVAETSAERWTRKFFEENGGLKMLAKLALRGFLSGHGFLWIKPVPKAQRERKKYPKIIPLDPSSVSVFWQADDVAEVLWYEMRYHVGGTAYIRDFVRMDDHWMIYTYKGTTKTDIDKIINIPTPHGEPAFWLNNLEFTGTNFELIDRARHAGEIPPIIDFAHLPHPDDFYGMGEFTEKDLQDAVNRIASLRSRIVREHSEPVDVVTGSDADEIDDEGSVITIENAQARVWRMEMKGDLSGITIVLEKLIETYLAIARVVLLKGEAKDLQRVTNAAVRTLFLDAISKNVLLQASYGGALAQVAKLGLLMAYEAGHIEENPQDIEVLVKFGSALPTDMSEVANINAIGINAGYMSLQEAATNQDMYWPEQQQAMESEHKWKQQFVEEVEKGPEIQPE